MMPDLFTPEPWYEGLFGALDFETTGVDPFTSRPVSFAFGIVDLAGKVTVSLSGLVDCGVEIPAEATAVHGITAQRLKAEGMTPDTAVGLIAQCISDAAREKIPVCIMNARFDWPLLLEEGARYNVEIPKVDLLDPSLLDKGVDRYRKGKRKLTNLCAHYGVELEDAHSASADAIATAWLTRVIIARYPQLQRMSLTAIATWQASVFEEYRRFLCSDGTRKIAKGWPIPEKTIDLMDALKSSLADAKATT